jgi:hypothetical protein
VANVRLLAGIYALAGVAGRFCRAAASQERQAARVQKMEGLIADLAKVPGRP